MRAFKIVVKFFIVHHEQKSNGTLLAEPKTESTKESAHVKCKLVENGRKVVEISTNSSHLQNASL